MIDPDISVNEPNMRDNEDETLVADTKPPEELSPHISLPPPAAPTAAAASPFANLVETFT